MSIVAIEWTGGALRFIDQTRLPSEWVIRETTDYRVVAEAIRRLEIRGAPAIGLAAAHGLLLAARAAAHLPLGDFHRAVSEASRVLLSTRPTAVNLRHALSRMEKAAATATAGETEPILRALETESAAMMEEDREACDRIAVAGAALLPPNAVVLTHCNTGSLVTAGTGTALGILKHAFRTSGIRTVYATETRPLLQGARLTAWELMQEGLPGVLITDNMAGHVLREKGVHAVIVGADRIAMNGDTANKIGTYGLAVIAAYHRVPFYVAAPVSTIDPTLNGGEGIPIEERDPAEVTSLGGVRIAPEGVVALSPAFDVTPSTLIDAIITDHGVARAPYRPALKEALSLPRGHEGNAV